MLKCECAYFEYNKHVTETSCIEMLSLMRSVAWMQNLIYLKYIVAKTLEATEMCF